MAQARSSMRKIREILRLKFELGLTERQILTAVGAIQVGYERELLAHRTRSCRVQYAFLIAIGHNRDHLRTARHQPQYFVGREPFRDVPRIAVIDDFIATSGQPTCKLVNGWTQVLVVGSIETPPVRNKQAGCVTGSRQDAAGRFRLLVLGNQIPTPKHSSVLHLNLCGTLEECAHIPWVPARSDQAKQFEMGQ